MIYHHAPQGSDAWLAARCGVLTASVMADAIAVLTKASGDKKAGEPTAAADEACAIVAIERVSGVPYRNQIETRATREGHEQEPELRFAYEARTGKFVTEVGLITTDDGRVGYSSDGLVDHDGAIEGKTLVSAAQAFKFLANPQAFIAQYRIQCLTGLWITARRWIDLVVWIPQLEVVNRHLHIFRIERDDDEINALETKMLAALRRIDAYESFLRAGAPAVTTTPPWDDAEMAAIALPQQVTTPRPVAAPPASAARAALPANLFA